MGDLSLIGFTNSTVGYFTEVQRTSSTFCNESITGSVKSYNKFLKNINASENCFTAKPKWWNLIADENLSTLLKILFIRYDPPVPFRIIGIVLNIICISSKIFELYI